MIAGNTPENMEVLMNSLLNTELQRCQMKLLLEKLKLNDKKQSLSLLRCSVALLRFNMGLE